MAKDKNVIVSGNPSDKEIRQSSSMTYFKGALTHTEMRILVKVVERVQHIFYGVSMKGLDKVPDLTREERTIRIPLRELEHGTNNTAVRTAADYLSRLQLSYSDERYEWALVNFFEILGKQKIRGVLEMVVTQSFLDCMFHSGGWQTFYNVDVIMSLKSSYSMRLYEMMSRQDRREHPIDIPFGELKEYFGLKGVKHVSATRKVPFDKYARIDNFIMRVIEPAKKDLDEHSPYTFEYEVVRDPGREPVFRFRSVHQIHLDSSAGALLAANSVGFSLVTALGEKALMVLTSREGYGFTEQELKNNIDLLMRFRKATTEPLETFLCRKLEIARCKDNPKGWIIGTVSSILDSIG